MNAGKFNRRELATIIAALRMWQRLGVARDVPEQEIATDAGNEKPLHDHDIAELVDRLNREER